MNYDRRSSDLAQANTYQAFAILVLALDATAPQQRPRALFWDQRPQIACCGPSAHKSPRCASGLLRVLLDPTSYDGSRIMLPSPMPAAAATGQPRAGACGFGKRVLVRTVRYTAIYMIQLTQTQTAMSQDLTGAARHVVASGVHTFLGNAAAAGRLTPRVGPRPKAQSQG